MPAGGFRTFVAGEVLDEDDINDFLMQGMLVFADSTERGSAITAPVHGQISFLTDSDTIEFYDGSDWVVLDTAPSTPTISGGNGTATSGGYTYHWFTSSGDLVVTDDGLVDVLLVAAGGGAGGGSRSGGGGGGGGVLLYEGLYLPAGTATVVVGAGGAGAAGGGGFPAGLPGNQASLGDFIAPGGGGGAGNEMIGHSGGCGGGSGAGDNAIDRGEVLPGFGFRGGGGNNNQGNSGGGGGFGGAGATGGGGGVGTDTYSVWASATSTGDSGYYAGGGAGTTGSGGDGGGGNSGGQNGAANTGGGGGAQAGNGGSGLVIVRYEV